MIPFELSLDDILRALGPVIYETLIMVGISSLTTVVLGLPLGMVLFVTRRGGIVADPVLSVTLSTIANIAHSIPYVILMLNPIPFTRWLIESSVGPMAACVLLTIGAAPFLVRFVESALRDVYPGKVDAAHAMGSTRMQTATKILLPEAGPSLIAATTTTVVMLVGYSAMAGLIGGGGLGRFTYSYGYQRFGTSVQLITIMVLVEMVQLVQMLGNVVICRVDHR